MDDTVLPNIPYRTEFNDEEAARVAEEFRVRRGGAIRNATTLIPTFTRRHVRKATIF